MGSPAESPRNFSSAASARTSATMASGHDAGRGHGEDVRARLGGPPRSSPRAVSTVRSARGMPDIGFMAGRGRAHLTVVISPSVPSAAVRGPGDAGLARLDLVDGRGCCVTAPRRLCCSTSTPLIAWTPIRARASRASRRRSEVDMLPETRRRASTAQPLTTPPKVSPSDPPAARLGDDCGMVVWSKAASLVGVDGGEAHPGRHAPGAVTRSPARRYGAEHSETEHLPQESLAATPGPRRREQLFPRRWPASRTGRPSSSSYSASHQVGMSRSWLGQRGVVGCSSTPTPDWVGR